MPKKQTKVTKWEDLEEIEREILWLIAQGYSHQEIEKKLSSNDLMLNHRLSTENSSLSLYRKIGVKNKTGAAAWTKANSRELELESQLAQDKVDERFKSFFYKYRENFATSIRLIGAADEFFPANSVHIIPDKTSFELPDEFLAERMEVIRRLKERADKQGAMFFDGPNTRLIDYRVSPRNSTEQKHLEMHLGPISWYDYSVCKWHLKQKIEHRTLDEFQKFVDLEDIINSRSIKSNKIGNILCTATTIVTLDGFVLYSERSSQVSTEPSRLTSAIAENIHQEFDRSLEPQSSNSLPAPFMTVIRGMEEEVSPKLADQLRSHPHLIFLLGLDFDLVSIQPDLLFMVFLPFGYAQIQSLCQQYPGKDFIEGKLKAVSSEETETLDTILANPGWLPSGKASLMRTLEFLDTIQSANPTKQFKELLPLLATKNV